MLKNTGNVTQMNTIRTSLYREVLMGTPMEELGGKLADIGAEKLVGLVGHSNALEILSRVPTGADSLITLINGGQFSEFAETFGIGVVKSMADGITPDQLGRMFAGSGGVDGMKLMSEMGTKNFIDMFGGIDSPYQVTKIDNILTAMKGQIGSSDVALQQFADLLTEYPDGRLLNTLGMNKVLALLPEPELAVTTWALNKQGAHWVDMENIFSENMTDAQKFAAIDQAFKNSDGYGLHLWEEAKRLLGDDVIAVLDTLRGSITSLADGLVTGSLRDWHELITGAPANLRQITMALQHAEIKGRTLAASVESQIGRFIASNDQLIRAKLGAVGVEATEATVRSVARTAVREGAGNLTDEVLEAAIDTAVTVTKTAGTVSKWAKLAGPIGMMISIGVDIGLGTKALIAAIRDPDASSEDYVMAVAAMLGVDFVWTSLKAFFIRPGDPLQSWLDSKMVDVYYDSGNYATRDDAQADWDIDHATYNMDDFDFKYNAEQIAITDMMERAERLYPGAYEYRDSNNDAGVKWLGSEAEEPHFRINADGDLFVAHVGPIPEPSGVESWDDLSLNNLKNSDYFQSQLKRYYELNTYGRGIMFDRRVRNTIARDLNGSEDVAVKHAEKKTLEHIARMTPEKIEGYNGEYEANGEWSWKHGYEPQFGVDKSGDIVLAGFFGRDGGVISQMHMDAMTQTESWDLDKIDSSFEMNAQNFRENIHTFFDVLGGSDYSTQLRVTADGNRQLMVEYDAETAKFTVYDPDTDIYQHGDTAEMVIYLLEDYERFVVESPVPLGEWGVTSIYEEVEKLRANLFNMCCTGISSYEDRFALGDELRDCIDQQWDEIVRRVGVEMNNNSEFKSAEHLSGVLEEIFSEEVANDLLVKYGI